MPQSLVPLRYHSAYHVQSRVMLNETAPTEAGQPFMELIHQLQQCDNWVADVRHGGKKAWMRGHIGSTMTPMAYCATGTMFGFRTSLLCVRK